MPGVEAAGLASHSPPLHVTSVRDFHLAGGRESNEARANERVVSAGYFEVLGIPIVRGRAFDAHDQAGGGRAVAISESLARKYWPNENPLGQSIMLREYRKETAAEIVGIAHDARQTGLRNEPGDLIYSVYTQTEAEDDLTLLVKTHGDAVRMMPLLKREIRAVDRGQTLAQFTTLSELMASEVAEPRFYMVLLAGYGALALLLTTVGIGGLVVYTVSRRTQEIALRISFGASRSDLLGMFTAATLRLILIGLAIGIPSSLAITRLLRSLLFEVTPRDPATFISVAALLTVVSLAACLGAAFRAVRVAPGTVLRHE